MTDWRVIKKGSRFSQEKLAGLHKIPRKNVKRFTFFLRIIDI